MQTGLNRCQFVCSQGPQGKERIVSLQLMEKLIDRM